MHTEGGTPESGEHPVLSRDPLAQRFGVRLVRSEPGTAAVELDLVPELLNMHGTGHGAAIFALADIAYEIASNEHNTGDTLTVATGSDINFLHPARPGVPLRAQAVVRQPGRSALYDVQVSQTDQRGTRVIAELRGRTRTIPASVLSSQTTTEFSEPRPTPEGKV